MTSNRLQAKHIPDALFLKTVKSLSILPQVLVTPRFDGVAYHYWNVRPDRRWVFIWDLRLVWPFFPTKVIRAKTKALIKKGLLDGCYCGCRGDFELTPLGEKFISENEFPERIFVPHPTIKEKGN